MAKLSDLQNGKFYTTWHMHIRRLYKIAICIRCQQSMLSKKWLGAECTQYSELSVIILGEPPPSDT